MLFPKDKVLLKQESFGTDLLNDPVHICFASDELFIPYMGVALSSVAQHSPNLSIVFHIFINQISEFDKHALREIAQKYPHIRLELYHLNVNYFNEFWVSGSLSSACYYRLAIPSILDHLDKVAYIDADTLCISDLTPLFEIDISNYLVAVVEDVLDEANKMALERLGFNHQKPYFNSGFILFNLKKWREHDTDKQLEQLLTQVRHEKLKYHDQDILNILLQEQCLFIPNQYNCIIWTQTDLVAENIKIIHFAGGNKPWKFHTGKTVYIDYYNNTSWKINPLPHFHTPTDYRLAAKTYWRNREIYLASVYYCQYLLRRINKSFSGSLKTQ